MFFKINTSFSKNLCVVFQFYVGGNAALIAQKLATYPDLMVDQQFDISVLNTYTTFHLFRSSSFLLLVALQTRYNTVILDIRASLSQIQEFILSKWHKNK